jgi:hypothetical protein
MDIAISHIKGMVFCCTGKGGGQTSSRPSVHGASRWVNAGARRGTSRRSGSEPRPAHGRPGRARRSREGALRNRSPAELAAARAHAAAPPSRVPNSRTSGRAGALVGLQMSDFSSKKFPGFRQCIGGLVAPIHWRGSLCRRKGTVSDINGLLRGLVSCVRMRRRPRLFAPL